MKTLRSVQSLKDAGHIKPEEENSLIEVASKFSIAISPSVSEMIGVDVTGPVAKQFIPSTQELDIKDYESNDPVGDIYKTKIKGLVHRYPDRVLVKPVNVCPVYCRFCFRREQIGPGNKVLSDDELSKCYEYIAKDESIWEVILTGGDPLILQPKKLREIIESIDKIKHVKIIRIHSRIPMVDPDRITQDMLAVLTSRKPIYLVLHINSIKEFTVKNEEVIRNLIRAGVPLLSQGVLLKGVNDSEEELVKLFKHMVYLQIRPYYLHNLDRAEGTSHFRVPLKRAIDIVNKLQGSNSGLCLPKFVVDIPGGYGKSLVPNEYIQDNGKEIFVLTDHFGKKHTYTDD